jgi:hypothetical protein
MRDVEKSKAREKVLEAELEKLLGPHWSSSLGIGELALSLATPLAMYTG